MSVMDQITQNIDGVTYLTIAEKHQIMRTENLVHHIKFSHNCNLAPVQILVGFDLNFHCIL